MDSISLARKGRQELMSEMEHVNDVNLLRNIARAIETFREIESRLMACKNEDTEK